MTRDIAVIGAGSVGAAWAVGLSGAGHRVVVGVREPADPKHASVGSTSALATPSDATEGCEVIILAVPAPALADVVPSLGLQGGQIVVDATNAVGTPVPDGFDTVGEFVASLLPSDVGFVKAFNTIGAEHLADGRLGRDGAFLPIAGDDDARQVVAALGRDLGFDVAELGDRDLVGMMEDHARLWIHLAFAAGWGRDFGFVVARRSQP